MTPTPAPDEQAVADARTKLAQLGVQVEAMQAVLVRLLQDVVRAEHLIEQVGSSDLAAANEQLVIAALASRDEADARAQALREATQAARLDALTGLPTRGTLLEHFAQAVAGARRHGTRCALLFLDLDAFKALNDGHGHAFGDQVLKLAAQRLASAVREVDTVSRHGGDEFLVLLVDVAQPADAQAVADKLAAALGAPAEIGGQAVHITASIGIALYPDDGEDFDTLVTRADVAMYESKRAHAGPIAWHGGAAMPETAPRAGERRPPPRSGTPPADTRLAALREANEHLVLAALDAKALHAAAEQARARQSAFLAAVADELRNPMAPIRIATAMLGRPSADEPLLPRVRHIVEQQISQITRLVDAVNAEGGGLALEQRRVDVTEVVDRAVATVGPAMTARGQRFAVQRPPGPLEVMGDAAGLEQIVANLLDNASRHTQDSGRITLEIRAEPETLHLAVSDNGIGITPQQLPLVFEPFVQDPRALGLDGVGLGVGLTAARALARAHGGDITAHSAGASRGSRFVLTLPRAPLAPRPATAAAAAAQDAGPVS